MLESNTANGAPEQANSRIIILGLMSILLCATTLMSVFTPFPLVMANIIYGRKKGIALFVGCLVLISLVSIKFLALPHVIGMYLASGLFSMAASEIIFRKIHPIEGLLKGGSTLIIMLGGFLASLVFSIEGSLKGHIVNWIKTMKPLQEESLKPVIEKGSEQALELLALFSNPESYVDKYLLWFVPLALVGTLFWLWAILLVVLRSQAAFGDKRNYPYTEQDLLKFQMPDWMIFPLIGLLVYTLAGNEWLAPIHKDIGLSLLYIMGVFYFFQGFGIFTEFLNLMRIGGIFRTFFMVFVIVAAPQIIAITGLFDTWLDFRKKIEERRKKNEGDEI